MLISCLFRALAKRLEGMHGLGELASALVRALINGEAVQSHKLKQPSCLGTVDTGPALKVRVLK